MIVVALIAVGLVTPGELRSRRERRHLARISEYYLSYAVIHDKERAVCESSATFVPYNWEERRDSQGGYCYSPSFPRFGNWPEEARWHAKRAAEDRAEAASKAYEEQAARRRLILPVIFEIKRTAQ
jgi:hypothetical protein